MECDDTRITDDVKKANALNKFFASVLTQEPEGPVPDSYPKQPLQSNVFDFVIYPEDVRKKMASLKKNKASGPDQIHVNVLGEVLDFDVPLANIFTYSLQTGAIPQDWRDANITPLHKKGSRMKCNNYRPVSLTSQVAKLLERLVQEQLWEHIKRNNLITCDQHGFQSNCSCTTQLIECLSDWVEAYDRKVGIDAIYLDFSKAFDTVPHRRLICKLRNLGIKGRVLNWLEAFLSGRRQRVVLRDGISEWLNVTSGVPQGSILGPVLFLLYVNDLPDSVTSTAKLFADDTKLYRIINDDKDCEELQKDLNTLSAWSRAWLLQFNAEKCVVLRIRDSINYLYSLNGVPLENVTNQKDLGITISHTLTPAKHIAISCRKAMQRLGTIRRCFNNLNEPKLRILYTTLVRPLIEYGSIIWNPWLKKDIGALEKVQRRCERMCVDGKLQLESLSERRKRIDLCETYKFLNRSYKTDPDTLFSYPTRQLRGHSHKLFKPRAQTEVCKHFFSHRVVEPWNSLPQIVVSAPTVGTFKKRLRALPLSEEG